MKILVVGSSGLVGSRFVELSKYKDTLFAPGKKDLDITQPNLDLRGADIVINFAAYTNVGEGENQRGDQNGLCWKLNVEGVRNLVHALGPNTFFIQISTDMVFSGLSGPYSEDDAVENDSSKATWYGYTKGLGEIEARGHTILRLIYPVRAKFDAKPDYLRKPLKLFDEGKLYPMFTDQQVSIAFIDEIVMALDRIIDQKARGIFHVSSPDTATPFELVSYLLEKARGAKDAVKPASLDEFLKTVSNPVRYPKHGGLKVDKTEKMLGIKFTPWRQIIDKLIGQGMAVNT